jgi:hypothetical protein
MKNAAILSATLRASVSLRTEPDIKPSISRTSGRIYTRAAADKTLEVADSMTTLSPTQAPIKLLAVTVIVF